MIGTLQVIWPAIIFGLLAMGFAAAMIGPRPWEHIYGQIHYPLYALEGDRIRVVDAVTGDTSDYFMPEDRDFKDAAELAEYLNWLGGGDAEDAAG